MTTLFPKKHTHTLSLTLHHQAQSAGKHISVMAKKKGKNKNFATTFTFYEG